MSFNLAFFHAIAAAWINTVITFSVAMAQTAEFGITPKRNDATVKVMRPPRFDVKLETSYTAPGKAKFRGEDFSDSDVYNVRFGLRTRSQLNEHWSIPLELRSQHLYLGSLAGAPVPAEINTLQFGTGLSYRSHNRWMFNAVLSPPFYKLVDIGGNDFGITGGFTAMWNYCPWLKFMFGVFYRPDSDLGVLPLVGFDWVINNRFNLHLMFPKPRIVYRPYDHWSFQIGADINMITFRTEDSLGTSIGLPQYNDALGNYRDIRVGAGAGYRIGKTLSVEANIGQSVNRQIDYAEIDEQVEFDPATYLSLSLLWRF